MRSERQQRLWKGLLAGALGGFVASFAMSQFHSLLLPKVGAPSGQNNEDSTVKAASAISHGLFDCELTAQQKKIAGPVVHYTFGAGVGAIYGITAEFVPAARVGSGMPFGVAVWLGAHVIALPVLDLSEPVTESALAPEAAEFGAHLVYGGAVEVVRRAIRVYLFR